MWSQLRTLPCISILFLNLCVSSALAGPLQFSGSGVSANISSAFSQMKKSVLRVDPNVFRTLGGDPGGLGEDKDAIEVPYLPLQTKLDQDATSIKFRDGGISVVQLRPSVKVSRENFFSQYAEGFGLKLKAEDAETRDRLEEVSSSAIDSYQGPISGKKVYLYKHYYRGDGGPEVPVLGGEFRLIEEEGGAEGPHVVEGFGRLAGNIHVDTHPKISEGQAQSAAQAYLSGDTPGKVPVGALSSLASVVSKPDSSLSGKLSAGSLALGQLPEETSYKNLWIIFEDPQGDPKTAVLSWRVSASKGPHEDYWVEVNAATGEVIRAIPQQMHENPPPTDGGAAPEESPVALSDGGGNSGVTVPKGQKPAGVNGTNAICHGETFFYGDQDFVCAKMDWNPQGGYYLGCDATPGEGGAACLATIEIYDLRDEALAESDGKGMLFTNSLENPADPSDWNAKDVVGISLFWGLQKISKFYFDNFKYVGFDGVGKKPILAYLRSFWDGWVSNFDGKGINFFPNDPKQAADLNLIDGFTTTAHEYTHGVFYELTNNYYFAESGALNEGFANLMAVFANMKLKSAASWEIFENLFTGIVPNKIIVNLAYPKQSHCVSYTDGQEPYCPDTYQGQFFVPTGPDCNLKCDNTGKCVEWDNDLCGVHNNGMLVGHAFYLMMEGKEGINDLNNAYQVSPLGPTISEAYKKVMLVAFNTMKNLGPISTFKDTRHVSIKVAEQLFGPKSPEVQTVTNAWYAIGVGGRYDERFFKPFDGDPRINSENVTLKWSMMDGEAQWEVQLATDLRFKNAQSAIGCEIDPVEKSPEGKALCTHKFSVQPIQHYYWRVRPISASDTDEAPSSSSDGEGPTAPAELGSSSWSLLNPLAGLTSKEVKVDSSSNQKPSAIVATLKDPGWGAVNEFLTIHEKIQMISPKEGQGVSTFGVIFKWKPIKGVDGYHVLFYDSKALTSPRILTVEGEQGSETPIMDFHATPHDWYWSVRPYRKLQNSEILGIDSELWHIQIDPNLTRPKLEYPLESDLLPQNMPATKFRWSAVEFAQSYQVQFYANAAMKPGVALGAPIPVTTNSYDVAAAKDLNGLCWQVTAFGENNLKGEPSEIHCYGVKQLDPPILQTPNAWVAEGSNVFFSWTAVPGAASYRLVVQAKSGAIVIDKEVAGNSTSEAGVSSDPSGYTWRVAALNEYKSEGKSSVNGHYDIVSAPVWIKPDAQGNQVSSVQTGDTVAIVFYWDSKKAPNGYWFIVQEMPSYNVFGQGPIPPGFESVSKVLGSDQKMAQMTLKPNTQYHAQVHLLDAKNHLMGIKAETTFQTPPLSKESKNDNSTKCQALGAMEAQLISPSPAISTCNSPSGYTHVGASPYVQVAWKPVSGATQYKVQFHKVGNGAPQLAVEKVYQNQTQSEPLPVEYNVCYAINVIPGNDCVAGKIQGEGLGFFPIP